VGHRRTKTNINDRFEIDNRYLFIHLPSAEAKVAAVAAEGANVVRPKQINRMEVVSQINPNVMNLVRAQNKLKLAEKLKLQRNNQDIEAQAVHGRIDYVEMEKLMPAHLDYPGQKVYKASSAIPTTFGSADRFTDHPL
jgi:hypothetical protein